MVTTALGHPSPTNNRDHADKNRRRMMPGKNPGLCKEGSEGNAGLALVYENIVDWQESAGEGNGVGGAVVAVVVLYMPRAALQKA